MGRQPVLTDVFERISDAFVALDRNWCYTYMNKKAGEIFNRNPGEMTGKHIWTEFPGVIDQPFYKACHHARSTQEYIYLEEYYPSYDRWLENHVYPSAEGLSIFFRDITAPKKAEEKILKANRLYNFLSSINHMIIRTKDQSSLFKEVCEIAVSVGQFRMAWIGMIDENANEIMPVMFAGEERGYLTGIEKIASVAIPPGKGPTGTAVREGRIVVCHDIETDPLLASLREEALARGYRSSIALPIKRFEKIIGAFTVYASERDFFDVAETALLNEATKDIAFALEILEKEELRKNAEEALVKSERRYQTLAEISPVGIFHTDETGYTTYVNPAWCRISGLPFEKALANGWLDAVHDGDKEGLAKTWEEAAKSHRISLMEYRFVRPDGSIRWVMGQAVPEKNPENEVIGYVGTITDITDRKKAEEDLRFNKQQLHLIYDSVADPIFLLDVKENNRFTFISVNQTFLAATGLTEEQVLNKDINDILPPSSLNLVLGKYEEAILNKKSIHWEEVSEYPAGVKTGIVSVTPVFDNKGNCTRLVGTVHDITGPKKYEEMLLTEKRFSESIINSLPGILYLYDEDRKFIRWNKNFQLVSEYSDEEIAAMDPLDFFDDIEKKEVEEKIRQVFITGMAEVEAGFFTKSKTRIPYYFNGCRITLENKTCLIGMGVDISELKNARDAVAEREKRFSHTLDQMMEGVQIYDFDWRCLYINDAAVRQGPHPKEVVLNKTLTENYPGI
jgi:PAS domain S-box-containing protein